MKNKKRYTIVEKDERAVKIAGYMILTVMSLLAIVPFVILLSASLSTEDSIIKYGYSIFPKEFGTGAWEYLWQARMVIGKAYLMTIVLTVIGTTLSVMITSMLAYGLFRKAAGYKLVTLMLMFTMIFNGGIVSSYYIWAGLLEISNTFAALLFPNLLTNAFTVILVLSYYKTGIPGSLIESARLDGAGEFVVYSKIILPLSGPILATVALMQAIMYWNDWTNGLYYIDVEHADLYTIQQLLNQMSTQIEFLKNNPNFITSGAELPSATVRMAIAFIGVLPLIISFPFFQKYFAKGLTMGSVKGLKFYRRAGEAMSAIEFREFTCCYAGKKKNEYVTALHQLDLSIENGQFVAVVGASGAGKTTLLRACLKMGDYYSGELLIDGVDIEKVNVHNGSFAYLPQTPSLYLHMTVYENIAQPLRNMKTPQPEVDCRVKEMATLVGMEHFLTRKPRQLSVGQQQRLALAHGLIRNPRFLFMDEPFANVDPAGKSALYQLVTDIHKRFRPTVLIVTHDEEEACRLAQRMLRLEDGRLTEDRLLHHRED